MDCFNNGGKFEFTLFLHTVDVKFVLGDNRNHRKLCPILNQSSRHSHRTTELRGTPARPWLLVFASGE